jgi:hypothetical protein
LEDCHVSVDHLVGKRTGRRKGSKSRPHWQRAVRWVERYLGDPDAKPPSPLAGRLLALANQDMAGFLRCLATLDRQDDDGNRNAAAARPLDPQPSATPVLAASPASAALPAPPAGPKIKTISLGVDGLQVVKRDFTNVPAHPDLYSLMLIAAALKHLWKKLPGGAAFLGCVEDRSRMRIVFTVRSEMFPPVVEGTPVPEFRPDLRA